MSKEIQKLAEEVAAQFEQDKRSDGTRYWRLKSGRDQKVQDLVRDAHRIDGHLILPDDYRYEFAKEALDAIAEYEDTDEARDSLEADIYTSDLTKWLGSNVYRPGYVDETMEEMGVRDGSDIITQMQMGQLHEKEEVFDSVLKSLQEMADEQEEEEEEQEQEANE
jgi:hypothetical protein